MPMKRPRTPLIQLTLGVATQFASTVFLATPPFLIPALLQETNLSLAEAGLMAAVPNLGMVLMLVIWGALADRFGERFVLTTGLGLTALAALAGSLLDDPVLLAASFLAGGMAGASANAASGRIVIGWARPDRRGLSMGIRQMAVPLGVMVAAMLVPTLALDFGISGALMLTLVISGIVFPVCVIGLRNPPRPARKIDSGTQVSDNPYSGTRYLVSVHAASTLLVIPQQALQTFGLVWLTTDLAWSAATAGALIGGAQLLGALGRVVAGTLSDSIGRMRIVRHIALSGIAILIFLGVSAYMGWTIVAAALFVLATCISVADNGPAFTSVAEFAGPHWAGRALGIQNTSQHLVAFSVGPSVGALIAATGFPLALGLLAAAPAAALVLIPPSDRRHESA